MISALLTILFAVIGVGCWFIAFFTFALSGLGHGPGKQDKQVIWGAIGMGGTFFYFAYKAWTEL